MKSIGRLFLTVTTLALLLLSPVNSYSLEGFDYDTGNYVEFDNSNALNPNDDNEIYDENDDSWHDITIVEYRRDLSPIEIEIYDHDKGEYMTIIVEKVRKAHQS